MGRILHRNTGHQLMQTVEIERLKLEASVNSEIAILLKMSSSHLIIQHFLNPNDEELKKITFEDIEGYRRSFASQSLFWVKDADKEFWLDSKYAYTVDPDDPEHYWYNMTMYETERYNFNINYNPNLRVTNLWINAPVFDSQYKPIGMLGTGVNLSDFINAIYQSYSGKAELYFFNAAGEITGAEDVDLVAEKVNITGKFGKTGEEIFIESKKLNTGEIKNINTSEWDGIASFGYIPALNWYIAAIQRFTIIDSLRTGMSVLFIAINAVILTVVIIFNIFIFGMLEPLNRMVKVIIQNFSDLNLAEDTHVYKKDEIGTLGELFYLTIIDQLTGIYNRRYFDGNIKRIIKSNSRAGGSLSVLMIDVDFFKEYNDTYGHDAGDNCLKIIANVLAASITRTEDFVARYGGEEFVVILPNADRKGAQVVAEYILDKVRECKIPHGKSNIAEYVTVSIGGTAGIVYHLQHGSDYIKRADKALYESKNKGRNRYTFVYLEE
ncbi:MAG: sensor domain-containing diguanylate cyclase [Treponema sp.]|nr:sensor domain-containing diguanylate cyclase [Treponema sp.]